MAMGRSKPVPSFWMSAGARLTVTSGCRKVVAGVLQGRLDPVLALLHGGVGQADGGEGGSPWAMSTSTSTMMASTPSRAPLFTLASIRFPCTTPPEFSRAPGRQPLAPPLFSAGPSRPALELYRMNGRMVPPNMAKITTRTMTSMTTFSLHK